MTTPQDIQIEIQNLEPSAIIELFELKLTENINGINETLLYHAGTNGLSADVKFNSKTYSAYPIEVDGFEMTNKGVLPRPLMRVANANSTISALILLYNPLKAQVTRIRTCKKFLDSSNFSGTNATADPTAKFEDEIWYIDRVANENLEVVEFELSSKLDLTNLALPRRQIVEHCPWEYKGSECGYKGKNFFDINDNKTNSSNDVCGKSYDSCRKRFTGKQNLPFGGFPGARLQI